MSADNSIVIGIFPSKNSQREYRVIHAQAIENCDDRPDLPAKITDCYRIIYFADANVKTFNNADDAWECAYNLETEIGYVEYGIRQTTFDRPLINVSCEEANKIIDNYFEIYKVYA